MRNRLLSLMITLASTLTGLLALAYPFFAREKAVLGGIGWARANEMPGLMTLLLGLCLLVLLAELQGQAINTRLVALLGVLVAINSALRFIETAIPGPGGFSPIFFLIILVGYTFGGRMGFLMGALTLFVSGLVTGGIGPWLPGQMFTAGWVGMSAALLRRVVRFSGKVFLRSGRRPATESADKPPPSRQSAKGETLALAVFGVLWGFLFGAVMNLWEWPYIAGPLEQSWAPGLGLGEMFQRYAVFYLFTSLAWDAVGAAGNLLLFLAFGAPALRALRRFQQRFVFHYRQADMLPGEPGRSLQAEVR